VPTSTGRANAKFDRTTQMKGKRPFRAGSPLRFAPPSPSACRGCRGSTNLPKFSFDSRRGVTLESFASRSERSGLSADDEPAQLPGLASTTVAKPIAGQLLHPRGCNACSELHEFWGNGNRRDLQILLRPWAITVIRRFYRLYALNGKSGHEGRWALDAK
jgi:hypothetical protein